MFLLFPIFLMIILGVIVLMLASSWRLYEKAGRQGWEGIVPIYNVYVQLEIIGRPTWWLLLLFVPIINIIVAIRILDLFVKCFGKDEIYTLGCILLPIIFIPALAFSDADYDGPLDAEWESETSVANHKPKDSEFV